MENQMILKNTSLKVLILEDSLLDLELMTGQLSTAGYQLDVTHAEEETGFREALKGKKYDIILSDFKLPGFDAFGALEICLEICPEVPFICVSGSIGEELAIELLKKGAVDYVLKDRPERLPYAINYALENAKEKAALFKATQELQESENRFRQVAETAQEWIWEVDTNGLYTYASPVIELLLGFTPEEVVGKKYFYDFFIPEKREELKIAASEVFAKRVNFNHFDNILLHKNGQLVIATTSGSPVFDDNGNFKGYRGVDEDITERMQAEEKRRQSDERFRIAQDMSPDGFTILNPVRDAQNRVIDFIWIYENDAIARMNGTDPQKIVGQCVLAVFPSHRDTQFFKNYQQVAEYGKSTTFEEGYFSKAMQKQAWLRIVVVPMGENIAILAQDITDRKKAEDTLKIKMDELERFHKLTVGREINMVELKKEVNNLLKKLGENPKYKIVE